MNESPSDYATLVDVTCDSDGKIDRFVDLKDVKETLELHNWNDGEDYYLGIFLTGAYQEVMGSYHNLFGSPNEAHVVIDNDGRYHVTKIVSGSRITDMMQFARYEVSQLVESFRRQVSARVAAGEMTQADAEQIVHQYMQGSNASTYLE